MHALPEPPVPPAPAAGLRIGAVLLAAGAASRMGHRPKCLLEREGRPLVRRQLDALAAAGVAPVVVVLGHYRERIGAAIAGADVVRVVNPDPGAPQNASLHRGLGALPEGLDAVLVTLADLPLIGAAEIGALIGAWRHRPAGTRFVRPWVEGQPGHPVLFEAGVRDEMLRAGAAGTGPAWAAAHPQAVHRWPSANTNHVCDVDSPQDLAALAAQGIALRWPDDLAG